MRKKNFPTSQSQTCVNALPLHCISKYYLNAFTAISASLTASIASSGLLDRIFFSILPHPFIFNNILRYFNSEVLILKAITH